MNDAKGGVVVAMSGGVDSSAAAALLLAQGYQVRGVTFRLWEDEALSSLGPAPHRPLDYVEAARETAGRLGIEHTVIELRQRFFSRVIEPFVEEYMGGRTPIPAWSATAGSSSPPCWRRQKRRVWPISPLGTTPA